MAHSTNTLRRAPASLRRDFGRGALAVALGVAMLHPAAQVAPTGAGTAVQAAPAAPATAGASSASIARAARAEDIVPLADGVWLLPGRFERGRQPDGNSLLLQGGDGLVIVDSGRHAEHSDALLDWAGARDRPLRLVINTHWHLDHLGGNARLRRAVPGLRSMASPAVLDAVDRRMPRSEAELQRMLADPALDADTRRMVQIDLALYAERAALRPDELVEGPSREVELAGRRVRIGVERGVSGGDLWLLDLASGVLALGDFVTLPVPFFDTACPDEWRQAFERLDALPFERVVPGHGPVMSRADFGRYRRAFQRLLDCAAGDRPSAQCAADWAADLGPLLPPDAQRSAMAMLEHYFAQVLRAAPAQRDRVCRG
jgi:glyoxylase-like metal-dependent hydrolase (beta-lactamase superfamily II)